MKKKKRKPERELSILDDLKSLVEKDDATTPRCKRCTHFGKDKNRCGLCKLTGENVARNHSCQENFKRKKKPSTSVSSGA